MEQLLEFDIALFWLINGAHSGFFDIFFHAISHLGNGYICGPILIVIVLLKTPRKRMVHVLLISAVALSSGGLVTSTLKKTIKRPRPPLYFQQQAETVAGSESTAALTRTVHVVGPRHKRRSFPSGHATMAFGAATMLTVTFGATFAYTYILALLVGYSRVYLGVHFPLDIVAGAILSTAITFGLMTWGYRLFPPPAVAAALQDEKKHA